MRHFPISVWIAVLATGSWHNPATAQTSWRKADAGWVSQPLALYITGRHIPC